MATEPIPTADAERAGAPAGQELPRDAARGAAEVVVRDYRAGDEGELNALFNLVFGRERSLEEWRWKFEGNARLSGGGVPVTVAEAEGRIVGQWARLVVPFQVRGRRLRAAQVVDNLVHPDFRAGGHVQRRLSAVQPALARREGIAFGYGFPDETAYLLGKLVLGYRDVGTLRTLVRPLHGPRALGRRLSLPPGLLRAAAGGLAALHRGALGALPRRGVTVEAVAAFDERFDALWESARSGYGILAVRDRASLAWRYGAKPGGGYVTLLAMRRGRPAGYAVLKTVEERGVRLGRIVDLLACPDRDVEAVLVRASLGWCLAQRADYAGCRLLGEDRLAAPLRAHGFREDPAFPGVPVVCYAYGETVDAALLADPRQWHLTYGDSDDT